MSTQHDHAGAPQPPGAGWAVPDTAPARPAAAAPPPPGATDFSGMRPPPVPHGEWATTTPTDGLWDTMGGGRPPSSRPTYREPHQVRLLSTAAGAASTAAFFLLVGMTSWNVRSYAWFTIIAGVLAWLTAFVLARFGDRGVAVGVAGVVGVATGVVGVVVAMSLFNGEWILW